MESKKPYPKSVFFIVVNEFCERFSYYGMKAVLTLYLTNVLLYSENSATVIYHVFSMFCYFTPLFGAMLADSLLGKFKTILYLSIVYAIGNIVLALAATTPLQLPPTTFSMLGLALIAIGTGGIKPCVCAFGGDQFILPDQDKQLSSFFSIFYFSINAGSLISTFIMPIFRKDVKCFDADTCYPLAFGVPAALMVTALVIFVIGKPWYIIKRAEGNIVMKVGSCISYAIRQKWSSKSSKAHWLDHAADRYDKTLIEDIKIVTRVLLLYIPLPVFWALFDQQGSRWTLQATRMDGEIFGMLIKPDQMQVINPFLILALIPCFDQIIYPMLNKCNLLTKPLQRLTVGGLLAGVAFVISGVLELKLEPTYAVTLQSNQSHLNFINTLPCEVSLSIDPALETHSIPQLENLLFKTVPSMKYQATLKVNGSQPECLSFAEAKIEFEATSEEAFTYVIASENGKLALLKDKNPDELMKSREGNPKVKMILTGMNNQVDANASLFLTDEAGKVLYKLNFHQNVSTIFTPEPGKYQLLVNIPANEIANKDSKSIKLTKSPILVRLGGNYIISLSQHGSDIPNAMLYTITEPNSVHMLWLLPQYIVITVGEVMFSITGLEFSFSQAPVSMKSVMQAAWLLTVAFGNLIVVFIAEFVKLDKQSNEFFLFAGLMFLDMIIFAIMAYFYKPAQITEDNSKDIPMDHTGKENKGYNE